MTPTYSDTKEVLATGAYVYFAAWFAYLHKKHGPDGFDQILEMLHHGDKESMIEIAEQLEDTNLPTVAETLREYAKKLPTRFTLDNYGDKLNGARTLKQAKEKWQAHRKGREV